MAALWKNNLVNGRRRSGESGQALMEFALIGSVMIILLLGLIDLGRAIFDKEVMSDLTRTGSNLASRGPCGTLTACLTTAANAVMTQPSDLNMSANGMVIVTAVQADGAGNATIIGQYTQGTVAGASSKVGVQGNPPTLPATTPPIPPKNQTIYVTEVFYSFTPITPIGKFMTIAFPSTLYDVAYF
ncbi:MAG: TadE/TadG family type IV pilus assembly protein [Candidatus Korobacteraceae bacterium]